VPFAKTVYAPRWIAASPMESGAVSMSLSAER
jgi:hypothetical protein